MIHPFAIHKNFLDPLTDEKGNPYGPARYKQLVKELYLISKNLNTSYTDLLTITPMEKNYLLSFLVDDFNRQKEDMERVKAEREANRRK